MISGFVSLLLFIHHILLRIVISGMWLLKRIWIIRPSDDKRRVLIGAVLIIFFVIGTIRATSAVIRVVRMLRLIRVVVVRLVVVGATITIIAVYLLLIGVRMPRIVRPRVASARTMRSLTTA